MQGVILTEEQLRREVAYFLKQDAFAFDVETMDGVYPYTRGMPTQNTVVWIALATHGRTVCIPMGHPNGDIQLQKAHRKKDPETKKYVQHPFIYNEPPKQLRPSLVFEILRPLFFSTKIKKIAHNETFDAISIAKYYEDTIPCGPMEDTIVLQWLLDENIGQPATGPKRPMGKGLKTLIEWYYSVDYDKDNVGKCIEAHPFSEVARYVMLDVRYDWLLWKKFTPRVLEEALERISALENEVTEVCCQMGLVGAPVDVQAIEELRVELTHRLEVVEAKVFRAAGRVFNINSSPQKQEILYGKKKDGGQGLKPNKFSKKTGDPSTDKKALEEHKGNPVVDAILEYQELDKLLGTYVIGYLGEEGNPEKPRRIFNGRIHTDLVQYGTTTGRFSSREPNLQNIPAPRSDLGKRVRGLFRAPTGYKLLVADYGQMELRILASYIGYGGLFDGFQQGIDAHTQTAALVYGVAVDAVQKWMRDNAKTLNFAIVYGAQSKQVADTLGISVEEAEKLLADHKQAFPEIYKFKNYILKIARDREIPHIRTILGRERRVYEISRKWAEPVAKTVPWWEASKHDFAVRYVMSRGERQIINSLIQGSLGDIIKLAMVRLHKVLMEDASKNPGREIQLILSVHDELVVLCPEDRVEEGSAMLMEAMVGSEIQDLFSVPLDVGKVAVVDRWNEAK